MYFSRQPVATDVAAEVKERLGAVVERACVA